MGLLLTPDLLHSILRAFCDPKAVGLWGGTSIAAGLQELEWNRGPR